MAASDTARLDVVLRCQLHAIVAAVASVTFVCICHRRGFEELAPGMDLDATRHRRWAQDGITALSLKESGTAALSRRHGVDV
jgi:hypothetical protein